MGLKVSVTLGVAAWMMVGASATQGASTAGSQSKAVGIEFASALVDSEIKGATPSRASTPATRSTYAPSAILGQGYGGEVEPNNDFSTATPLASTNLVVRANLFPGADMDFYSFSATAGDRVYAAVMTSFSAGSSTDSQLTVIASDGSTIIEFDDDDGTFAGFSSSIAGAVIPSTGTYFIKVNDFNMTTATERGYELHVRLQSGAPTPEVEPNDTPATANPLPANGWVSGSRDPALATEQDWYSIALNAGDTVYLSLDLDPERDGVVWNGRLGFGLFGDADNQILTVNDPGSVDAIPSEAMFMTVKNAGTYFAFVDSATAAVGGPTATYRLSVSVHPAVDEGVNCTTYTSVDAPQAIGPAAGLTSSTITVPGNPRIADVDVSIVLNHALMADVDVNLRSPAGNDNGIFTDIGATATGGQTMMDITFDDEAGIPPGYTAVRGVQIKPELQYRLGWLDGENAGGVWTLDVRDDLTNTSGGTLTSWSMRICEAPPPPTCPAGFALQTVHSTDFEAGAAGYTHSGVLDEWALGLPATLATTTTNPVAAFNNCNSGTSCWKTDLTGTYESNNSQDLLSPAIDLTGLSAPIVVSWAQRYQMESASFDHLFVDYQQVGGATPLRLFEHLDATMTNTAGSPTVNLPASSGWSQRSVRADALAGLNTEIRFHVDGDSSINFGGMAVDDVSVTACRALSADAAISKTDGVATAVPGGSTTYTIVASNIGPDPITAGTVTDTFPAALTCNWTCAGAAGGTCPASGAGNINATVALPVGGTATFSAVCAISAAATGSLANTATIVAGVTDPNAANNSATDTDTLTPQADLGITKSNGVTTVGAGQMTTYTIVASNAGPSNAPGSVITDNFSADLTGCSTTCVGAGGATCPAGPMAGNFNSVANIPVGGTATYSATCTVSPAAVGSISNTASIATGAGVTSLNAANNSQTDTDTVGLSADLFITKTDGVASATPGGSVTYTIVASTAGPSAVTGATVSDMFPASCVGVTWTCLGDGGGTCTASGSGNINDSVNLPTGFSTVSYTAICPISAAATGTLVNTATVTAPAGVTDPNALNNSATDTDTLGAVADLSITKTDGLVSAAPGALVTYTIVASNAGPSNATGATVVDTFPASCVGVSWTCVGAGGGTCVASGSGNINQTVNLPSGASTTFTASCTISAGASGTLSNTATVTAPAGVTDPTPANSSATDGTFIVSPPVMVPSNTLLALLLLMFGIGLSGVWLVGRRS